VPTVELLPVIADYRFSPFGTGCLATIAAPDLPARTVHGADVHDAVHEVLDEIGRLADEQDCRVLTMHALAGDPQAFAELAEREGFAACLNDPI
jgi:hypothetical protein